jgi:hypothetical protein
LLLSDGPVSDAHVDQAVPWRRAGKIPWQSEDCASARDPDKVVRHLQSRLLNLRCATLIASSRSNGVHSGVAARMLSRCDRDHRAFANDFGLKPAPIAGDEEKSAKSCLSALRSRDSVLSIELGHLPRMDAADNLGLGNVTEQREPEPNIHVIGVLQVGNVVLDLFLRAGSCRNPTRNNS